MTEAPIFSALLNLGGTGVLVYVLWRLLEKVLERQAQDHAETRNILTGALKENAVAMQGNAVALSRVEKALNGLWSNHERRISELEDAKE